MKKRVLISLGVLAVLIAGYWLVSPFFIDKTVSEDAPRIAGEDSPATVKKGTFTGFDRIHQGSGTAVLLESDGTYVLRFEDDFSVTNGPDLYVGFGNAGVYDGDSELAPLKGNKGSQNYELSAGFDPEKHGEVWIWCRAFSVPFARAVFEDII